MARSARRKQRKNNGLDKSGRGKFAEGIKERLRSLIRSRAQSFAAFAKSCSIDPPRVSEWLGGEHLPSAAQLALIARATGVSIDWLLMGEDGEAPVFRNASRGKSTLELDLAFEMRRFIHQRESEGAFDIDGGSGMRLGLERWIVDGTGLLNDLRDREEKKVRAWIEWEARTLSLRRIADDIVEALKALVPALPADDKELGAQVYHLGRAALEARAFGAGLGVPEAPNSFRGLRMTDHSHPVVGPKEALRQIESEGRDLRWDEPAPLADRVKAGNAGITPIKPWS